MRQTTIQTLICPSWRGDDGPISCYAGVHHDKEAPIDVDNNGVLFLNSKITFDDLKDGSAYTLFVGEKNTDTHRPRLDERYAGTLRNTGTLINAPLNPNGAAPANGTTGAPVPLGGNQQQRTQCRLPFDGRPDGRP